MFLKYMSPLFLILFLLMVIHGFVFPWEASKGILSNFDDSIIIQTGFYKGSEYSSGSNIHEESREYLVIDKDLRSKSIYVYENNEGEFEVTEDSGGLIRIIIELSVLLYFTWYCWMKTNEDSETET